jgi:hypothetical protein
MLMMGDLHNNHAGTRYMNSEKQPAVFVSMQNRTAIRHKLPFLLC